MAPQAHQQLSRRERQIMDIVYTASQATAKQVVAAMSDPPTRTAVRTMLRILEDKGHLKHKKLGREFVYLPTRPRKRVGQSAFRRVLETFYSGSLEDAVAAHLSDPSAKLTGDELKRLEQLIRQAKNKGA